MKQIKVSKNEAGQRLDKLLGKYLREAPKSFLYKMIRKKNITLNGRKAQGNEILQLGDEITLFLAEETITKFQGKTSYPYIPLDIIYEDDHILLINKPSGMLSQKAKPEDISLTEYLIGYLLKNGSLREEELVSFHPSVCNRLDRNTSGIVVAGKSLTGLQVMSRMLNDRSLKKYYRCIVKGSMQKDAYLKGYLVKDHRTNMVRVVKSQDNPDALPIETEYHVIHAGREHSLLEVHLITGRSHQIRAHLASTGHPILGDTKYGDQNINEIYRRSHGVKSQLLHAYRLEFPKMDGPLCDLSGRVFTAPLPSVFHAIDEQKVIQKV